MVEWIEMLLDGIWLCKPIQVSTLVVEWIEIR